jgi:hypothetical protein
MTTLEQIITHSQNLPESLQNEALDFIKFLEKKHLIDSTNVKYALHGEQTDSEKLFSLMEEGAKLNLFSQWGDPVAWQKETRKDRTLLKR